MCASISTPFKSPLARVSALALLCGALISTSACNADDEPFEASTPSIAPVQQEVEGNGQTAPPPAELGASAVMDEAEERAAEPAAEPVPREMNKIAKARPKRAKSTTRGAAVRKMEKKMVRRPKPTPPTQVSPPKGEPQGAEDYKNYGVNPFVDPTRDKLSTFSIDVDTGAYTIARRKLKSRVLPPSAAVRVEEFVNFFKYDSYPQPDGALPFAVSFEAAPSPLTRNTTLMRVGVQGRRLSQDERKPAHLVFLVDTSGSMQSPDKLGLARQALHLLVNQLNDQDTVALCTYAGSTTEVLQPTGMAHRAAIHEAIEQLAAGGSTAMADGLETAYKMAYKTLKPGHVNRIIVLSDGDANVGQDSHAGILKRIGHYTQEGVTLSTIGLGMGNYKDTMMEQLANKGNGNYFYIDSFKQARRIFTKQLGGTLQVIAKDVKIQVEFNPEVVAGYRLVGYENRDIADKDFRNDAVDAGEIGAGHSVTALYELKLKPKGFTGEPAVVRIRHKAPEGANAMETEYRVGARHHRANYDESSQDFRLAVAAAAFAEKLRESPHARDWAWERVEDLTKTAADPTSEDEQELLRLVQTASELASR